MPLRSGSQRDGGGCGGGCPRGSWLLRAQLPLHRVAWRRAWPALVPLSRMSPGPSLPRGSRARASARTPAQRDRPAHSGLLPPRGQAGPPLFHTAWGTRQDRRGPGAPVWGHPPGPQGHPEAQPLQSREPRAGSPGHPERVRVRFWAKLLIKKIHPRGPTISRTPVPGVRGLRGGPAALSAGGGPFFLRASCPGGICPPNSPAREGNPPPSAQAPARGGGRPRGRGRTGLVRDRPSSQRAGLGHFLRGRL